MPVNPATFRGFPTSSVKWTLLQNLVLTQLVAHQTLLLVFKGQWELLCERVLCYVSNCLCVWYVLCQNCLLRGSFYLFIYLLTKFHLHFYFASQLDLNVLSLSMLVILISSLFLFLISFLGYGSDRDHYHR